MLFDLFTWSLFIGACVLGAMIGGFVLGAWIGGFVGCFTGGVLVIVAIVAISWGAGG